MPFVQTPNLSLYYEQCGAGPPCLILSGTGSDLRIKPNVLDFPLSDLFSVTAYDQRGLGQSDIPPPPYTMADYANDAAALLDHLAIDAAVIFGVSFGGMVAQELAIRFPERVKRLALFCTTSGGDGGASFPLHTLAQLSVKERILRMTALSDTRHDAAWIDAHPDVIAAQIAQAEKANQLVQNPLGPKSQLEARATHNTWDRLTSIQCPVWVAGGRHDGIATPEAVTALAKQIPQAQLHLYDGGHLFWNTSPQSIGDLREFLSANRQ